MMNLYSSQHTSGLHTGVQSNIDIAGSLVGFGKGTFSQQNLVFVHVKMNMLRCPLSLPLLNEGRCHGGVDANVDFLEVGQLVKHKRHNIYQLRTNVVIEQGNFAYPFEDGAIGVIQELGHHILQFVACDVFTQERGVVGIEIQRLFIIVEVIQQQPGDFGVTGKNFALTFFLGLHTERAFRLGNGR